MLVICGTETWISLLHAFKCCGIEAWRNLSLHTVLYLLFLLGLGVGVGGYYCYEVERSMPELGVFEKLGPYEL